MNQNGRFIMMQRQLYVAVLCLPLSACIFGKKNEDTKVDAGPAGPMVAPAIVENFPKQYCENIETPKPRSDIASELGIFCKGSAPTDKFTKFYKDAMSQAPGSFTLVAVVPPRHDDEGYSHLVYAWSFHVPIKVSDFRSKPLETALSSPINSDNLTLMTAYEKQPEGTLDGALHLMSLKLNYELSIKTGTDLPLTNVRNTEYNLYQVKGGNENLGLGVEHLTDSENKDYKKSTMVNLSLTAPSEKAGTVVVTLLSFTLANQNFTKTAEDSIKEIAGHSARAMYDALMK